VGSAVGEAEGFEADGALRLRDATGAVRPVRSGSVELLATPGAA
jgi:biotin-(acetyl-CoA carboxylase) ligase